MGVTRGEVLRRLAASSSADREATTTVSALAETCDADKLEVRSRIEALADCHLARIYTDGRVRVTITGEELLELDVSEPVIIDPGGRGFIGDRAQTVTGMEADRR